MKSLIMLYVFGIVSISFAQTSQLRYEGQIEGGGLSGTLTSQQFEVSLRRPDNCGGNLGLTQWTANTITIKDGVFTLAPQFDSSKLAKAMDPNNDFAATCSTPYEARELVIRWHDGTNWETFYVPLSDAPRATYALNSGAIGNVEVNPTMTCGTGQYLRFDSVGNKLTCSPILAADIPSLSASVISSGTLSPAVIPTFAGDVTGSISSAVVEKIRGTNVVSTTPTSGQVLKFDGTNWVPSADDSGVTSDASYFAKGIVQINTDQTTSGLYINNGVLALPNVIVADTAVGDAQTIPVITYDQKGRLTAVGTTPVDDDTKLPLAGGAMQGSIDMGTNSITNATNIASTNVSTRNVVLNDNDSNTITIKAPADVTPGNYTLTLPPAKGVSGQVLALDGLGNFEWFTPGAGGGSVTQVTSTNSYLTVADTTTTPQITANVGTTANTLAAGDDARIVGALQAADYATDLEDVGSCTDTQTVYWNTMADKWTCQNIDFSASGAFIDGGNSFGADATLGTNDPYPLFFETDGSPRMTITNDGRVGIGTTNPIFDGLEIRKNNVPNMGIAIVNDDSNSQARYPAMLIQNHIGAALAGGYPIITLANSRGSASSPASINNGDTLGRFEAHGRGNSGSSLAASIEFKANQPFNSGGYGTDIIFSTVPLNTLTEKPILRLTGQYAGGTALGLVKIEPDSALILGPNFGTNDSWYQLEPGAMWFNSTENVVKYSDGSNARSIASQNASNTFTALNTFQSEVEFQNGLRVGSPGSKMESFATCSDAELITSLSAHNQTTITLMNCPDFQIGMIPQCVFDESSETNASNLMIQELVTNTPGEVRLKIINFSPNSFSAKTIAFECTGIKASL